MSILVERVAEQNQASLPLTIGDLDRLRESLPPSERELFDRHYLIIPTKVTIGGIDQTIVRIQSQITRHEEAIFNSARADRTPPSGNQEDYQAFVEELDAKIETTRGVDPFCLLEEETPEDDFSGGRIKGEYNATARNKFGWDGYHSLIIFNEHNSLREVTQKAFHDHFKTAYQWFNRIHDEMDPNYIYPLLIWNLMKNAGASQLHPHFQISLARKAHYGQVENLIETARKYQSEFGTNYFNDLSLLHGGLGLGFPIDGTNVCVPLTPIKEDEVRIFTHRLDGKALDVVYNTYRFFREDRKAFALNMTVVFPPLNDDGRELWKLPIPVVVSIVKRGDWWQQNSDFGGMELSAAKVVSHNPFSLANSLKEKLTAHSAGAL